MDKTTVPSGTSPPPLPAGGNAHDDVSAFASAMMSSQPSSDEPKVVAAIDPTYSATAADVLPASDHECANCGNLANKRCTGCDRGVEINGDKSSPTYYCSKDCQRDHRKTHEFHCKLAIDRSQLFRIGRLVQWAFYESIKAMWSDGILDVEKVEDTDRVELRVQVLKQTPAWQTRAKFLRAHLPFLLRSTITKISPQENPPLSPVPQPIHLQLAA
jgi:hypothetical protein